MRVAPRKATAALERIVASQNPDDLGEAGSALKRWRTNKRVVYGM